MGVRLRVLGSGDAFGSGGRFQTCLLLEADTSATLIDCGASTLIALKRAGVDPAGIDQVVLSHLHGDHFGGLPFLILDAQFARRTRPLTVLGPAGVAARVHATMEALFPGSSATAQRFDLRFRELADGETLALGRLGVTGFTVRHASGAPAFALRLNCQDRVIAYSGDSEWSEGLIRAADGADLFICEAYYREKQIPYHLSYRTLQEHRAELRCKRLLLTHMSQDMLGQLDTIEDETAWDGMVIDL